MNQLVMRDCAGRFFLVALTLCLAVLFAGCGADTEPPRPPQADALEKEAEPKDTQANAEDQEAAGDEQTTKLTTCDGANTAEVPKDLAGAPLARALMEQWRRDHPEREWVAEQREAHAFNPPADNSDVLEGEQADGHAYGNFTPQDLLTWQRETETLVAEGSRIFHSNGELGSTVAVSCDMCHPHASNTHPETYPKYQTQVGRVALLRDMINWCVENPVRARALDPDGARMRALEAYIMAQRKGVELDYGKH